ncbi:MAG TPA: alpha/beta hydrolase [Pyrinomonadaceae bacterium]|nr:alpha/beta hydrolase [Pyrinomonadaceae bacterium]
MRLVLLLMFIVGLASGTVAPQQSALPAGETNGIREVSVKFQSGAVTLAGTVLIPPGQQRHPAIVLTHGSGSGPRIGNRMFADRFARNGLVVLLFDKRGSGESGGSWTNASLDDLADDAIAAANFLRSRDEVDPGHVGVWGVSQAGWVIPRAIARSPDAFQFAIVITGGGVKPIEVERYDYSQALDHLNVTAEQRRQALKLVESYFEYLRTGIGLKALEAAIAAAKSEPWFPAVDISRVVPAENIRTKWAWVATYDPARDLEQIKVPVLVVFGGRDRPRLSLIAQEVWRTALLKAGNKDSTEVVFIDAEHGVTIAGTHGQYLAIAAGRHGDGPPKYASGYLELVDAWLKAHCGLR